MVRRICSILGREEHGAGGEHDGGVIEDPAEVELHEVVDGLSHKWVVLLGEHKVVGNTDRFCPRKDDRVDEERVHRADAAHIEVHVDTAIVVEDEVTDNVGTLDGVCVAIEGVEKPTVVLCNKLTSTGIGPKHVLAIGV